jgi:hypothetical protein
VRKIEEKEVCLLKNTEKEVRLLYSLGDGEG